MDFMNALPSEICAVVGTIDPDAYLEGTFDSDWVDAGSFQRFAVIVMTGDLHASSTLAVQVREGTDSSGTGAQDISDKAITTVSGATSPLDKDQQMIINIIDTDLDLDDDYTHFSVRATQASGSPAGQAVDFAVVVLGFFCRNGLASDNDLASVTEIVN